MPKVIVSDKKGLNQVAGGGLEVKLGDLTWTRRLLTQDKTLEDGDTATQFDKVVLPQFSRIIAYKVEIVKAGGAAGTVGKIGTVGDDNMIHADASGVLDDFRTLGDKVSGYPLAAGAPAEGIAEANAANRVLDIEHTDPGAAGPTLRVSVIVETIA